MRKNKKTSEPPQPSVEEMRARSAKSLMLLNYVLAVSRQHVRLLADPTVLLLPDRPRRRRRRST